MKITFYKSTELEKPIRLAVHRSGKLGFSKEAETKLNFPTNKSVGIGRNEEDAKDESLYMVVYKDEPDGSFKVSKAGSYYYLNTKVLFDNLKIDYSKGTVAFDMEKTEIDGEVYYKLTRKKDTKKDNQEIKEEDKELEEMLG
jgi:hypothetical protein